jgi:uncharacterized protein YqeY
MDINVRLQEEMVAAAKSKDKIRLSVVRLMKTALHNKEISLMRPLQEAEVLQVIASMMKQRKDSIEQFAKGGRDDLVQREEAELKILQEFMPAQMSEENLDHLIKQAIEEAGAVSVKDMGKVMKILMPKIAGQADGKVVGEKVKAFLSC